MRYVSVYQVTDRYEKELRKARDIAFEEITETAQELGANALVRDTLGIVTIARCNYFFQLFFCEYSRFIRGCLT